MTNTREKLINRNTGDRISRPGISNNYKCAQGFKEKWAHNEEGNRRYKWNF